MHFVSMRSIFPIAASFFLLAVPFLSSAQAPQDFKGLVGIFLSIISFIIPLIFGLAFLMFLWGITRAWILGGGDEKSVTAGKQIALAGIIGFVVMVGVWGIVALVRDSIIN